MGNHPRLYDTYARYLLGHVDAMECAGILSEPEFEVTSPTGARFVVAPSRKSVVDALDRVGRMEVLGRVSGGRCIPARDGFGRGRRAPLLAGRVSPVESARAAVELHRVPSELHRVVTEFRRDSSGAVYSRCVLAGLVESWVELEGPATKGYPPSETLSDGFVATSVPAPASTGTETRLLTLTSAPEVVRSGTCAWKRGPSDVPMAHRLGHRKNVPARHAVLPEVPGKSQRASAPTAAVSDAIERAFDALWVPHAPARASVEAGRPSGWSEDRDHVDESTMRNYLTMSYTDGGVNPLLGGSRLSRVTARFHPPVRSGRTPFRFDVTSKGWGAPPGASFEPSCDHEAEIVGMWSGALERAGMCGIPSEWSCDGRADMPETMCES